jgi:hypothetical protein
MAELILALSPSSHRGKALAVAHYVPQYKPVGWAEIDALGLGRATFRAGKTGHRICAFHLLQ